jgi:mono/diheme cytochrome c family protein
MSDPTGKSEHDPELPHDAPAELPAPPLPRPPFWMIAIALVSIVVTWLPLALIARARVTKSAEPRIQIMQDMGVQPKYREQETDDAFADHRAMRPRIPNTVARGEIETDDNYAHGFTGTFDSATGKWTQLDFANSIPARFTNTPENMEKLLRRGEQRFNIYCYVCHGLDGSGHGPVNERAMELMADGTPGMSWTPAAQLTSDAIRKEPPGKIFNTVTNGIRTMPSYSGQISIDDRWAIVAYVKTLQYSQYAPQSALPSDKQTALNQK